MRRLHLRAAYSTLSSGVKPSVGSFDDLIPKYKPCWDYRTDDGKNIDITKLSDDALVRVYECQLKVDKSTLLKTAGAAGISGPLLTFMLGWSLLWLVGASDEVFRNNP